MTENTPDVLFEDGQTQLRRATSQDGRAVLIRETVPGARRAAATIRIRHDAELQASLKSSGSPRVVELVKSASGPSLVVEDPGGELLSSRSRPDLAGALRVMVAIAEALQKVHAEGVIHGHPVVPLARGAAPA